MNAQWLLPGARPASPPPHGAPRRRRLGIPLAASAAALAAALAGCSASAGTAPAGAISVTTGACGGRWHLAAAGWHTFTITNASSEEAEVNLINPANNAIYAEVEAMGPGTSQPMRLRVGSGTYAFQCVLEDTDPVLGPTVKVPGHVRGAPGVVPVTSNDMIVPSKEYHAYVTTGLVTLVKQTKALNAAIQAGQLAQAKKAWLPAHLTYEGLGAAYGTFGDFDGEIDTRADGLAGGVNDPQFTGFYRIEYGLWHGQSAAQLKGPAAALLHSVLALQAAFPAMEIDFLDIGLRTHEILENALQFQLSGHDDYGSGTTLATTAANITGTEELLTILHPLLVPRYPGLPGVYLWLGRLQSLLNAQHHGSAWTPVSQLPTATREQIDAAASQSLQELAPIAVITEPRRV
jgi:iron uptake system component EfeO